MNYSDFEIAIADEKMAVIDRAVAILWLGRRSHGIEGMTPKEIAKIMEEDCGHPRQNVSRLEFRLQGDNRTAKFGKDAYRLRPMSIRGLDEKYGPLISRPKKLVVGPGSVIPREIFQQSNRQFLLRVVDQVNGCYDLGFYDSCAVMARRLIETLLIEIYMQANRSDFLKDTAGYFLSLEQIIGKVSADQAVHLTRETKRLLPEIKKIGDQSAHNPRFNARQSEIDALKHGIRVASEELLNLCNYQSLSPPKAASGDEA